MNPLNKHHTLLISIVLVIVFLTFIPSLRNGFTNWDDNFLVLRNEHIHSLSWDNLKYIVTRKHMTLYSPLVMLSYTLEYQVFGETAFGYHLTNLILHLINCALVYWLLFLVTRVKFSAFLIALLFGIHPLHVEPVVWIASRKDVLYALFFLVSLVYYCHYRRENKAEYYYISIAAFVLSVLSKSMAITLPAVLLLFDWYARRKIDKKYILDKLPFVLISIVFVWITFIAAKGNVGKGNYTLLDNITNVANGLVFYVWKTFIPANLSCIYSSTGSITHLLPGILKFSYIFVIIIAMAVIISGFYTRIIVFGSLFFLVTMLPVLHIIPVGLRVPADRYTYIPLIGFFFIFAEGILWLNRKIHTRTILRILLMASGAMLILVLSVVSIKRIIIWRTSKTLWEDVIKNSPADYCANLNLGEYYFSVKEYDKTIEVYSKALKARPNTIQLIRSIALAYYSQEKYQEAFIEYSKAIQLDPRDSESHYFIGLIYKNYNNYEEAFKEFKKAITIRTDYAEAYYELGYIYNLIGEKKIAIEHYEKAVQSNPGFSGAVYNLGVLYFLNKDYEKALNELSKIADLDEYRTDLASKIRQLKDILGAE